MEVITVYCDTCVHSPPSSFGGKPCSFCNPDDPMMSSYAQRIREPTLEDMDIVYFVKDEPTNEELRYSLRSVEKNFPHRKVWFYGGCPDDLQPDRWAHIKQNARSKWGNTSGLLRNACTNEEISANFVLFNDDFFVMKPVSSLPYYSDGSLEDRIKELWTRHPSGSVYTTRMQLTMKALVLSQLPTENYAMHMPMIINRHEMQETFKKFPDGEMWRSLYGNHHHKPVEYMKDCKIYDRDEEPLADTLFLSTTDASFLYGKVGECIREKFPEPSRFEEVRT